jgi:hypothetical protein
MQYIKPTVSQPNSEKQLMIKILSLFSGFCLLLNLKTLNLSSETKISFGSNLPLPELRLQEAISFMDCFS